ncbi:MAG: PrsW family intramembrane metalloprotease [Chloroflexales bacterium]|nr:PrsW family intramembrane metalloprotease [Chloroflexales bacterium]
MSLLLLAIVLSFVPALVYASVIYWLDRYEKEPRLLLGGVFMWGAFVSTFGAIVWSLVFQGTFLLLTQSEGATEIFGASVVAPLVEETLKGLAVLIVFIAFRREFDSVLDGIVYGGIVGLGFAATENVLYLLSAADEGGVGGLIALWVLRVILGGWNHAFYTAFTGIGLALSRLSRSQYVRVTAPLLGIVFAMGAHATHNSIGTLLGDAGLAALGVTLLVDWFGWALMLGVVVWALRREGRWMRTYLREEVQHGVISQAQYATAISTWAQTGARLRALGAGRYRPIRRFYQLCGELAQKKHQRDVQGDEAGNNAIIERLRGELAQLAPSAI